MIKWKLFCTENPCFSNNFRSLFYKLITKAKVPFSVRLSTQWMVSRTFYARPRIGFTVEHRCINRQTLKRLQLSNKKFAWTNLIPCLALTICWERQSWEGNEGCQLSFHHAELTANFVDNSNIICIQTKYKTTNESLHISVCIIPKRVGIC